MARRCSSDKMCVTSMARRSLVWYSDVTQVQSSDRCGSARRHLHKYCQSNYISKLGSLLTNAALRFTPRCAAAFKAVVPTGAIFAFEGYFDVQAPEDVEGVEGGVVRGGVGWK